VTTPRGFRDILPEEALWREQIVGAVSGCFADAGYLPVETPVLEEADLLADSDAAGGDTFRLFDSDGALLMLRPDVTLPVARMVATRLRDAEGPFRLRYCAPVFRESDPLRGEARQFTQLGVELIGEEGLEADAEVLLLMARALEAAGVAGYVIALGSVRPLAALLAASGMPEAWCRQARLLCHRCDLIGLDALVEEAGDALAAPLRRALRELPRIRGGREAVEAARALLEPCGCADCGLDELLELAGRAQEAGVAGRVSVDFSVMGSFGYYTGTVIEAYAPGFGQHLGRGGRYDTVFERFGRPRPAAGFALSLDNIQAVLDRPGDAAARPLRVAVSKGSLFEGAVDLLARAGMDVADLGTPGRQLIIRADGVEYIIVRPTDAPAFVAFGGADCGICGRDSLIEANLDVLELADLDYGACRFVVAEPADASGRAEANYRRTGSVRVATKYPRITRAYFERIGVEADVLKFHGNIELAPLVGMADRIVDITATGTTLRENNLVVVDEVMTCAARFFANPAAARTDPRVFELAGRLAAAARERHAGREA
jgi:ATP phosphoribosyltransferase regulatory subunit